MGISSTKNTTVQTNTKLKSSPMQPDLGVLIRTASGFLTVNFFLLNAEVQVWTCHAFLPRAQHFHNSLVWAALGHPP